MFDNILLPTEISEKKCQTVKISYIAEKSATPSYCFFISVPAGFKSINQITDLRLHDFHAMIKKRGKYLL